MKHVTRLLGTIILAAAIWFVWLQMKGAWLGSKGLDGMEGISVVWEGKSLMAPDTLNINLSVSELAKSTALAQKQSDEKLAKVQEVLKTFEIDKKDIKTTNASISPDYDRSKSPQQLNGYRSIQSLAIKITGSGFEQKWADLIAKISEIWGITIDNTTFSLEDENKATERARENAFKDAQSKAEQLAKLAWVKLGKVSLITEQVIQSYPRPMYAVKEMMASDSAGWATPLSAGETEITMNISITYEIK